MLTAALFPAMLAGLPADGGQVAVALRMSVMPPEGWPPNGSWDIFTRTGNKVSPQHTILARRVRVLLSRHLLEVVPLSAGQ